MEVIGSIIYLQLIRKIELANKPGTQGQIDWKAYNFFTLLDKVDYERSKLVTKQKVTEEQKVEQEKVAKAKAAVEKAKQEAERQKIEILAKQEQLKKLPSRDHLIQIAKKALGIDLNKHVLVKKGEVIQEKHQIRRINKGLPEIKTDDDKPLNAYQQKPKLKTNMTRVRSGII